MGASIRIVETDAERDACYRIRETVFVEEQNVPRWEEMDADDEAATHFLVESDGEIIGTARLVEKSDGVGKIGRVAILADYRGRGIGMSLMQFVVAHGFQQCATLILDAQLSAIPFYERLGFAAEGNVFLDCDIEHRRMRRSKPPPTPLS